MKQAHCIVTLDGKALGLRCMFSNRKASAVLSPYEDPAVFPNRRQAKSAIQRTKDAAGKLRGTLIEGIPSLTYILKSGRYQIVPVEIVSSKCTPQ